MTNAKLKKIKKILQQKKAGEKVAKKKIKRGDRPPILMQQATIQPKKKGKAILLQDGEEIAIPTVQQQQKYSTSVSTLTECEANYDLAPWSGTRVKGMWVRTPVRELTRPVYQTIGEQEYARPSQQLYNLLCSNQSRDQDGNRLIFNNGVVVEIVYELKDDSYLQQDERLYELEKSYIEHKRKTNQELLDNMLTEDVSSSDRQVVVNILEDVVRDREYANALEKQLYDNGTSLSGYIQKLSNFLVWIQLPISNLNSLFVVKLKMHLISPELAVTLASAFGMNALDNLSTQKKRDEAWSVIRQSRENIEHDLERLFFTQRYPQKKIDSRRIPIHTIVHVPVCGDKTIPASDQIFFEGDCFSIKELQNQFLLGDYENEIGVPFPSQFIRLVSSIQTPNDVIPVEDKKETDDEFLQLVLREMEQLESKSLKYTSQSCHMCKSPQVQFKTFQKTKALDFCGPDCLERWNPVSV